MPKSAGIVACRRAAGIPWRHIVRAAPPPVRGGRMPQTIRPRSNNWYMPVASMVVAIAIVVLLVLLFG
jgi:hypothetical protein